MFEVGLASRGGAPLFRPFHVLKALWHIMSERQLGRKDLAGLLGIGEGSARKLLSHLEEKGWVTTTRQGIGLSVDGAALLGRIGLLAKEVHAGNITVGDIDFALRLRGCAEKVANGIAQRDEAIKVGASGATTLVFGEKLEFCDGFGADRADRRAARVLVKDLELEPGDLLIIGSSPSPELAMDGAFAAAVLTLDS